MTQVIAAITRDINARRRDPTHTLTVPGAAEILASIDGAASALAVDRYGKTASYHIEYPEDLQVFGVSFNTLLGASGWALQGEYSFHPDAPLQRTEASLFAEGLLPLTEALQGRPPSPELLAKLATRLQGYVERDVSQLQVTATKVFGPAAGSDGGAFITEAAVMHVHDMPDETRRPSTPAASAPRSPTPPPSATAPRRGSTTTTRSAPRGSLRTCSGSTT